MKPFTSGIWHVWRGAACFIVSNEYFKTLQYFNTTDECINYLYFQGYRAVAVELNEHLKENKNA